ncbi:MAG: isoprenyl transferase [Syntrophomonadaceae bacterium]|nr:isoprenyl transferase [Syntrophomonadaceae bacterium]MDD3888636.1 isoprenyl transferase [Syntrophomonadaceae bacterium]MDD4548259.1 isoprenyl transferase [Syntrophomonadaceae bacterium]
MGNNLKRIENLIDNDKLPRHIAIIMDGNGRWARKRLMPRTMGHRAGMSSLKTVVMICAQMGISVLTVYAFSTENWRRPRDEVDYLMSLLVEYLHKELNELDQNNIRIKILGDYTSLPPKCQQEIEDAVLLTTHNSGMVFNIALNYGSRNEIIGAIKNLGEKLLSREINIDSITEEMFSSMLYTAGSPDPDLLIRTAGEMRISNFLLWQIAYTELWITDRMWPDFTKEDLLQAIWDYQQRDRRFGGLNK